MQGGKGRRLKSEESDSCSLSHGPGTADRQGLPLLSALTLWDPGDSFILFSLLIYRGDTHYKWVESHSHLLYLGIGCCPRLLPHLPIHIHGISVILRVLTVFGEVVD